MVDVADRLGVAARTETRYLVERQIRTGGDHQVIVVNGAPVLELNAIFMRMDPPGTLLQIADAFLSHHLIEIDLDVRLAPPTDRDPRVRRHEMITWPLADDRQLI